MSNFADNGPRLITPEEFPGWVVEEDDDVIVVNKPGDIVCHPSKNGPWSSLVGACREHLGLPRVHMIYRLDRETSGVMVFAKNSTMAGRLQTAVEGRRVRKLYLAILCGDLRDPVVVDAPLGRDLASPIAARQAVVRGPEGRPAVTEFLPVARADTRFAECDPGLGGSTRSVCMRLSSDAPSWGTSFTDRTSCSFSSSSVAGSPRGSRSCSRCRVTLCTPLRCVSIQAKVAAHSDAPLTEDLRRFAASHMGIGPDAVAAAERDDGGS